MHEKPIHNIVLTGFMATGKSTVGKSLAQTLQLKFVDTDQLIEAKHGISIPEIFTQFGESEFRQMETDIARDLSEQEGLVIATGGRMMLDPVNVKLLKLKGQVFSLVATADEILERLLKDTNNERPLLAVADPKAKILELLEERKLGYNQFQTVNTSGKEATEIADNILKLLKK
ncbi:shikimate kinase [Desulforhopalus sp. 52FAK]